MKLNKKLLLVAASLLMVVSLSACGGETKPEAKPTEAGAKSEAPADAKAPEGDKKDEEILVGVALPQKTSENWVLAEGFFNEQLPAAGFKADVQFATAGVSSQQQQIDAMITNGAKAIIIGALDGSQLTTQIESAKKAGIKIIAYDRMLMNNDGTDYYMAYDATEVGRYQGKAVLQGLKELKGEAPWDIELFAGSPDDANSKLFFNGAMEILQPKIDDGTLKVVSGQTTFEQAATQGWDPKNAQSRMDTLLSGFYTGDAVPDAVLSPNDTLARAVITAVQNVKKPVPVLSGQDSEAESVRSIMQGVQYSTIDKDTAALVAASVSMVKQVLEGKTPEIDKTTVTKQNNGVIDVTSYLLQPTLVTKANAAEAYKNNKTLLDIVEKEGK